MWVIAVLLLIIFALLLFARIAKTRTMEWVFGGSAMAVCIGVMFLRWKDDSTFIATVGFVFLCGAISDLIAIPIVRRRTLPPCVRVKDLGYGRIAGIIAVLVVVALWLFSLVTRSIFSLEDNIFLGLIAVSFIINFAIAQFGKTEICRNGVCQNGRLYSWQQYESFAWGKTEDSVELNLVSESWSYPSARLMVPPEHREAVQRLLETDLPDLSTTRTTSQG